MLFYYQLQIVPLTRGVVLDESDFNEAPNSGDGVGMIWMIIKIFIFFGVIALIISASMRLTDWFSKLIGLY